MSRKMSFFEFWRSKKERGESLRRANQLKLLPSQLKRLLGDNAVRTALQNVGMASLLPPVGTEVFRHFTAASLEGIRRREAEEKEQENRKKNKEIAEKDHQKPARCLEAEKPLPFIYGKPAPEYLNTPLEELDPYYQSQKTFLVLGKRKTIYRYNADPACYLLSPLNPLRKVAIKILSHSALILLTILFNCIFMMVAGLTVIEEAEYVFKAIYTLEVIIKVVSRGFCVGKFTFLRDPWNWLDVMVISTAYPAMFVDLRKLVALISVPRVLKIIPLIPGLKSASYDFVRSVKRLAGVLILTAFCLSVFAVAAMQLFMGNLRHKCIKSFPWKLTSDTDLTFGYYGNDSFDYSQYTTSVENMYFRPGHLDALLCGNASDAGTCPEGFICIRAANNPNYGYTSYETFGWSLLSLLRLMTQDFWDNLMQLTLRASGKFYLTFFMLVIFPGCFCLLSLILAVVAKWSGEQLEARVAEANQKADVFSQIVLAVKKREEEEEEEEKQAASRAALSDKENGENKQKNTAMEELGHQRSNCPCCTVSSVDLLKWNCCSCWRWLKRQLHAVVVNPFFDLGIIICLIINIIFMSMEHFPMSPQFEEHLSVSCLVFTVIYTAEMVVKVVAMDPYNYFRVSWNVFESILVAISLLVLLLADVHGLSVLRSFIVLRIFRLARWWPGFHMWMKMMWSLVRALRNQVLLLLVLVLLFTIVGTQLFQKDYKDCACRISVDCELPRWHMNDYFHTFLLITRALFGEWIETLWDCMEVSGQAVCLPFFMMLLFIGNLMILNLFLVLLLMPFSSDDLEDPEEKRKNNLHIAIRQIHRAAAGSKTWVLEHVCTFLGNKGDHTVADNQEAKNKDYVALNLVTSDQPVSKEIELKSCEKEEANVKRCHEVRQDKDVGDQKADAPEDCCCHHCYRCCPFLDVDTSQGGGRVWSNFRRACLLIVQHKCFDIFFIFVILLSSASLMLEDIHLEQRQLLKTVVETADQVFTYLFLMEMFLKWIALGLKKYFTDPWCWLDFLILDVFLVSLMANKLGFSELGAIQFLRALGPLRVLSRFQGLKLVVQVLVRTIPSMISGLLVFQVVWLLFTIMGINMFAGKFFYCFNETSEEIMLHEEVNNQSQCYDLVMENFSEIRWKNGKFNFDNSVMGFLSLLLMAASSTWLDIMYSAVDSTWMQSQPIYEFNVAIYLFYIFFIVGSFFTMNFLISIILDHHQKGKFGEKHIFMTEQQRKYSKAMKNLFPKNPQKPVPRPQNKCLTQIFDLVTKPHFEVFMVVLICLNMVVLMVETPNQSYQADIILYWFHFLFLVIFLIEFILKIIAFRQYYFKDCWNILDFVVLIWCIVGLFLADLFYRYFFSSTALPVFRVVRVCRILYVIRCARGVRKLLLAFVTSLPALFNIGLVLFVIMVSFSIFGMFNFAYVKKEFMIDDMYNFETFWNSMTCVFMIGTSSDWGSMLMTIMNTPPDCDPLMENPGTTVRGNCSSPALGIVFFITYLVLYFVLVVHMYIAVVLETFKSEESEVLCEDDLQNFYKTWEKFDPDASQFIPYSKLSEFCDELQGPLRIPKPNAIKLIHMDLPLCPGDKVHCVDVFVSLAKQVLEDAGEIDSLKAKVEEKFIGNSSKVSHEPISSTLRRKQEEVAATVIQRAYRKGLLQHGDADQTGLKPVGGDSGSSHPGVTSE